MKTYLCLFAVLLFSSISLGQIHPSQADFNHDGKVDIADLAEFASAWLWESSCETAVDIQMQTHYVGATDGSYWYVFTPEFTAYYSFNLCGGSAAYTAWIYPSCEDASIGNTGESCWVGLPLTGGVSYYIEIQRTGEPVEDYDLVVTLSE